MRKVIWTGEVFYDGQSRKGRVVRAAEEGGDLAFEVEWGHAAMGEPIWKHSQEPFREFLVAAGALMEAAGTALGNPGSEQR